MALLQSLAWNLSHAVGAVKKKKKKFFFLAFLGPNPQHMEVCKPGIESDLQLQLPAYTTAM